MLFDINITNTDFNQTLQKVWLKSVLCSKLGGGLANSLIDFNVDVYPINNNYDEIKTMLHERILRNSDCVKQKASYVSMPDRLRSLDNMYDQNQTEKDLYFYHSDHLGSSSFITDADGITTQHLQYLPYGELFVEQRSTANYFAPYKFSAKEKDEETSYSYFGARYLASDFSFWLSVDPLADKYPYQSAYSYCGWRPINVIDPNGMDEWEVNQENGKMKNVKETDRDILFVVNNKGERVKDNEGNVKSQDIGEKHSMSKNTGTVDSQNDKLEPIKVDYTGLNFKTEESADMAFNFLADNTDVEWSQITSSSKIGENPKNKSSIYTSHMPKEEHAGAYFALRLKTSHINLIKFSHSHPRFKQEGFKTSESDVATKDVLLIEHTNAIFKLRWGGGRDRFYNNDRIK